MTINQFLYLLTEYYNTNWRNHFVCRPKSTRNILKTQARTRSDPKSPARLATIFASFKANIVSGVLKGFRGPWRVNKNILFYVEKESRTVLMLHTIMAHSDGSTRKLFVHQHFTKLWECNPNLTLVNISRFKPETAYVNTK